MEKIVAKVSKSGLQEKITAFSAIGATPKGGITRLALSPEDDTARRALISRMKALGMTVQTDDMANMYAVLPGEQDDLPAIAMGSHMDSVVRGGNYDGILGVLSALEVLETIVKAHVPHRHPLMLIDWTNEEGARFDPSMMGSGVVTGHLDKDKMLQSPDKGGVTFGQELKQSQWVGQADNRVLKQNLCSYTELHIEQGPRLEDADKQIGVVRGVMGMVNYEITLSGEKAHAGTYPMDKRKDALFAAVDLIADLKAELAKLNPSLVYTIGRFDVDPDIHTIVPGQVKFTLDARHESADVIAQVVAIIEAIPHVIDGVKVSYQRLWSRRTVEFDPALVSTVKQVADELKLSNMTLYSGAGHDAQYVATVLPGNMIFVPSINGLSHTESEMTAIADCWNGANVLLNSVLAYDRQ